jgi:hypothetical protein
MWWPLAPGITPALVILAISEEFGIFDGRIEEYRRCFDIDALDSMKG